MGQKKIKSLARRFAAGITAASLAAALSASVPVRAAGQTVTSAALLASFDFNEDAFNGQFVSGDATARINGSVSLRERDAVNGKALYLDGSASWLDVKLAGGSMLIGMEEATISFDAKPERTEANWGFYIAPNAGRQEYGREHYIGALINGGKTTVERYHNNGGRPESASVQTGSDWSHVDVVLTRNMTTIYVDGKKAARQARRMFWNTAAISWPIC